MASEFNNRIVLPPTEINFTTQVGTTGQPHDTFPAPGQQPRYDWMRLFLIGLLANQSSDTAPSNYRTGTIWFKRTTMEFMMWNGTAWVNISDAIMLYITGETSGMSLTAFYNMAIEKLDRIQPKFTYSGRITNDGVTKIPIPDSIQAGMAGLSQLLRAVIHINGILLDPRSCTMATGCPTFISIAGANLKAGDNFTVMIERFDIFLDEEILA